MIWSITEQISSRYVLLLHLQYDIYDTVKPAIFYRGARVNLDNDSVLSPPTTPATSFPIDVRILLFLTSELGEDVSGVLHDGILEIEWDEKTSSTMAVSVKLAFTDDHQENLIREWSVHMHMRSKSIEGIPSVLGVFHEDEDDGPSCFVSYCAGTSLADTKLSLAPNQRYAAPFVSLVSLNELCRTSFLASLHSIHTAGVLHGNLGLDNLLVTNSGDVIIANFSQAKMNTPEVQLQEEYQYMQVFFLGIP